MAKFDSPVTVPKPKKKTYNMTDEQLQLMQQDAKREGLRAGTYAANAMYSIAMLLVLRDHLGFGQKRLTRVFRAVQKLFDEIAADELAYKDAAEALRDECGVNLIIERPQGTPVDAMNLFRKIEVAKAGYHVKIR